jgi:hypothetical protein
MALAARQDLLLLRALDEPALEGPREGEQTEPLERGGGKISSNSAPSLSTSGPREGEQTEPVEKGGGKISSGVPLLLTGGPRPGEGTEPLEEGDR